MKIGDLIKYEVDNENDASFEVGIITNIEKGYYQGTNIITVWIGDESMFLPQHEVKVIS